MKLLIIGDKGQLGHELMARGPGAGLEVAGADLPDIDITDPASVARRLDADPPDLVINAAAYTAVDRAESEPEAAYAVNRDGPAMLARACRDRSVPLTHVSTDFVFDGEKGSPYTETDPVRPLGVYGASKAEGETAVRELLESHFIVRTAWLYGVHGANFVKTMIRLGRERETLRVVADQHGCPTSAADLADALLTMANQVRRGGDILWGTYHYCGSGITTWHGLAEAAIGQARAHVPMTVTEIVPIPTSEYPTPARRPAFSALDCGKIEAAFGVTRRPWAESLAETVDRIFA